MNLLFEVSSALGEHPTGIGRYIRNLVESVSNADTGIDVRLISKLSRINKKRDPMMPRSIPWHYYWGSLLPLAPRKGVVHGLDGIVPNWSGFKKAVTLHDVFPLLTDDDDLVPSSFRQLTENRYRQAVEISDIVITDSESTRSDVIEYFQLPDERVITVYPGAERDNCTADSRNDTGTAPRDLNINRDYFLFVGAISERKNTTRLVEAYARSGAQNEADLILVGPRGYRYEKTIQAVEDCGLTDSVHFAGYLDDEALALLYKGARALLFPTVYEGFGFPILEAMLSGCPVLAGNRGSAPEIAGDFAILVDPMEVDSITDGIRSLANGYKFDKDGARAHAESFSWSRCVEKLIGIYKSI